MAVPHIPDGYHSVTPFIVTQGADGVLDFLKNAFGAQERIRMDTPDGKVAHAEVTVGDSVIMVAEATAQFPPMPAFIHLYVEDVDGTYQRTLSLGATTKTEPEDQFYGDRAANVIDPFGNYWPLATHVEEVSDEEMQRRLAAIMAQS